MEWQCILFDMDGTLIESEAIHHQADMDTFATFGLPRDLKGPDEFMGFPDTEMFAQLIERYGLQTDVATMQQTKLKFIKQRVHEIQMVAGARDILDQAHQTGLPLGLVTASMPELITFFLTELELTPYFKQVKSGNDPDVEHNKPAPDVYLRCAALLGVNPNRCLVFEDSASGVSAACQAGMGVYALRGSHNLDVDFTTLPIIGVLERGFTGILLSELMTRSNTPTPII
jgi:beta-phosphoglucomutase